MGLKVPLIRVPPPGPKARAIIALDERYIATSTKTAPVVVKRAEGAVVEVSVPDTAVRDAAGNRMASPLQFSFSIVGATTDGGGLPAGLSFLLGPPPPRYWTAKLEPAPVAAPPMSASAVA